MNFGLFAELFGQVGRLKFHSTAQRLQDYQNFEFIERHIGSKSVIDIACVFVLWECRETYRLIANGNIDLLSRSIVSRWPNVI